ncbi:hypothetical protein PM082_009800 [Marasmius tenuissimus]|nr:hypothetical protein PM082_009800 [Marasmius tenuissimus]
MIYIRSTSTSPFAVIFGTPLLSTFEPIGTTRVDAGGQTTVRSTATSISTATLLAVEVKGISQGRFPPSVYHWCAGTSMSYIPPLLIGFNLMRE